MEHVQQVDAEYEHHQPDKQAQDECGSGVQRKGRSKSTDNASENEERDETTDMEQDLWLDLIALSRKGRRHRKHQAAHDGHTGRERSDDADKERRAVRDRACVHEVHETEFLQEHEQYAEPERNRYGYEEVQPFLFDRLLLDGNSVAVLQQNIGKFLCDSIRGAASELATDLNGVAYEV